MWRPLDSFEEGVSQPIYSGLSPQSVAVPIVIEGGFFIFHSCHFGLLVNEFDLSTGSSFPPQSGGDKIREINILGLSNSLSVRGTAYLAILNYAGRDFALIYGFQDYR